MISPSLGNHLSHSRRPQTFSLGQHTDQMRRWAEFVKFLHLHCLETLAVFLLCHLEQSLERVPHQIAAAHQLLPPKEHVDSLGHDCSRILRICHVLADDEPPTGLEKRVQIRDGGFLLRNTTEHPQADNFIEDLQVFGLGPVRMHQTYTNEVWKHTIHVCRTAQNVILAVQIGLLGRREQFRMHADTWLDSIDGSDVLRVGEMVHLFA